MVIPLARRVSNFYRYATELETVIVNDNRQIGGSTTYIFNEYFANSPKLKSVSFPFVSTVNNSYQDRPFNGDSSLTSVTMGSIGNPITTFSTSPTNAYKFFYGAPSGLTITVFVDAVDIASISTDITSMAPWGASNPTIIYKNSTTGEVLE